ncbi:hypothetical protein [Streptomyces brasiliscabiei]|uniref:hypothetical protein n=1 Tax=Streptomyces brasiliscabiei TaxID=2736302 RepID=UPI001C101284|nr:hypothetical protein [Streptomyces brasiliscabiei]
MPDTPAVTPAPTDHDDITARQPLPGTRLIAYRVPDWGIEGSYIHMDRADIHVTYAQVVGRAGQFPAQGVSYGLRTVGGRDVDSWLRGSLNFWLSSDARMADDGVIRYRQTRNHSVVTFVPDKASGVLINRPDEQVTAAAYRVTGPTGVTQLWRGQAVRDAIAKCRRKPPVGWPAGWAHLMPDATVRFEPGGFPWSPEEIYTAEPTDEPASWGPPCAECGYPASEHDPVRLWDRSRTDGTGCTCWAHHAQE